MKTKHTTKHALWASVTAIALCMAMLVGTTFAWFTDTASTGVNKISSGTLDVELEYSYDMENWETATSSTKLFNDDYLWEPGFTTFVYLRVKNNGTLALKYTMGLNSQVGFTNGVNMAGETYNVGDYLKIGTATVKQAFATREDAWKAIDATAKPIKDHTPFTGSEMPIVAPKTTTNPIALVIYMPTTVGNEANASAKKPSYVYRLGVEVNATQASYESDSIDASYDKKAPSQYHAVSSSSETLEITENIQANGRYGVVQAERTAQFTIDADLYAVYTKGGGLGAAMAVSASGTSTVIINGGDFRQVGVPADDPCDLIYGDGSAIITINGGTFKAEQPERTLNCKDGSSAKIIVNGGRFYKYDPSHPTLGDTEVELGTGCTVSQDGDWFVVTNN